MRTLLLVKVNDYDYMNTGAFKSYYVWLSNYGKGKLIPIDEDYLSLLVDLEQRPFLIVKEITCGLD